jgi:hypothetical protein
MGTPALPLARPFGVGLKDREDFFAMGDSFTQDDPATDLLNLAYGVRHEAFNFLFLVQALGQIGAAGHPVLVHQGQRLASLVQIALCDIDKRLMRLDDEGFVFLHLRGRAGLAAFFVLRAAHEALDVAQVVGPLAPVAHAQVFTPLRREGDDLAHRVQQQVDVGGVMNVGLNHKGVAAPTQGFGVLFFYQHMAGMDRAIASKFRGYPDEK